MFSGRQPCYRPHVSNRVTTIFLAAALAAAVPLFSRADDSAVENGSTNGLPLWEIGLFGGAGRLPRYRGSDEYKTYVLPLPFFVYRGKIFRANREGVKSVFWETDRFETGVSLSGNPPVDGDNDARDGMTDLGAVAEIGPMLKWSLLDPRNPNPLYAVAAVRAAVSVDTHDLDTAHEGWHGDLKLVYRNHSWLGKWGVAFGVNASVDFADRDFHEYFYEVEPRYATDERPAYSPDGGYSGFSLSANATKKLNRRLMLGTYYRWDNQAGTAYENSPLVQAENNHVVGLALIWNVYRSEAKSPYSSQ